MKINTQTNVQSLKLEKIPVFWINLQKKKMNRYVDCHYLNFLSLKTSLGFKYINVLIQAVTDVLVTNDFGWIYGWEYEKDNTMFFHNLFYCKVIYL